MSTGWGWREKPVFPPFLKEYTNKMQRNGSYLKKLNIHYNE